MQNTGILAREVLRKHGIRRFRFYDPKWRFVEEILDMTAFKRNRDLLPLAFLGAGEKKAHLCKTNSFFYKGQSYGSARDLDELVAVIEELPPDCRILSTMVLANRECHMYFDLDSSYGIAPDRPDFLKDSVLVMDSLWHFVALAMLKYAKRLPIGVTHEERPKHAVEYEACTPTKFSIHAHNPSEGFVSVEVLKAFVLNVMFPMLQRAAFDDSDPLVYNLGFWSQEKPKTYSTYYQQHPERGYFHIVIDLAVYTDNRVFRFPGCCKPGGATLKLFRGPVELKDNLRDQLRYALISHTVPVDPNAWHKATTADAGAILSFVPKHQNGEHKHAPTVKRTEQTERKFRGFQPRIKLHLEHVFPSSETTKQRIKVEEMLTSGTYKLTFGGWSRFECNAYFIQGYFTQVKGTRCPFHTVHPQFTCPMKVQIQYHSLLESECVITCKHSDQNEEIRRTLSAEDVDTLFPHRNRDETTLVPLEFATLFIVD